MRAKLRLWLTEGPYAFKGDRSWRSGDTTARHIAKVQGVDIDEDTYQEADTEVSQYRGTVWYTWYDRRDIVGKNYTAILPLEVEEP